MSRVRSPRSGFTILELLTVLAVTSVLFGLLVPAMGSAREAARRIECVNNLQQIGIALHLYHESHGGLPPGWRLDSSGETAFAWGTAILPYLEERHVAHRIDFHARVDSASNAPIRGITPSVLLCPSDIVQPTFALFEKQAMASSTTILLQLPSANYVGVFGTSDPDDVTGNMGEGAFVVNRSIRFVDFHRGSSNTLLVGERTARQLPSTWFGVVMAGEDAKGRVVGYVNLGPNRDDADECEFGSRHPGCVNFLWVDGHVKRVADSIDSAVYRQLASRD